MKYLSASIIALMLAATPLTAASALDVGIGPGGVHIGDRDRGRDRFRDRERFRERDRDRPRFVRGEREGCRTVIVRTFRDGATITKRIKRCG